VKIQERMLRVRDTMEIADRDGNRVAMVKKALLTRHCPCDARQGPCVQGHHAYEEFAVTG